MYTPQFSSCANWHKSLSLLLIGNLIATVAAIAIINDIIAIVRHWILFLFI